MKKLITLLLGLILAVSVFAQREGNEAMNEITSVQRILLQASESILEAENNLNQEIVHLEFDILRGTEYKYVARILHPGWTYTIYAEGESGMVEDADIKIMIQAPDTGEWHDVCKDEKDEPGGAFIQLQPPRALNYAIGVRIRRYAPGWSGAHYFFMIMHEKPNTNE